MPKRPPLCWAINNDTNSRCRNPAIEMVRNDGAELCKKHLQEFEQDVRGTQDEFNYFYKDRKARDLNMSKKAPLDTNELVTVTNKQQESQAVVMRLMEIGKAIDIDLPKTLSDQKQWALARYDEHIKSGLQLGYALVVIKQQMEHGEFSAWLEIHNIEKRTAQKNMKVATFLSVMQDSAADSNIKNDHSSFLESSQGNPTLDPHVEIEQEVDAVLAKIIKLPLYKQLVLASQPTEKIKQWWQSDLFKDIEKMSPTNIRALIRQELEIEKLKGQAAENTKLLKSKHDEAEFYKKLPENDARIREMQSQIVEDMQTMQGIFDRAHKTFNAVRTYTLEAEEDVLHAVVSPLLHLLNFSKGETLLLTQDLFERFTIDPAIPVDPPTEKQLSNEQVWLATTAIERQHQQTRNYLGN